MLNNKWADSKLHPKNKEEQLKMMPELEQKKKMKNKK